MPSDKPTNNYPKVAFARLFVYNSGYYTNELRRCVMIFSRLFLFINGLLGLALGGYVVSVESLSLLDIQLTGAAMIEVRTAMGGAWLALGLYWCIASFGRRLRTGVGSLAGFYLVTAVARGLAMRFGGSTDTTLAFLAFELVTAIIAAWLFFSTLAPSQRRIFGS